MRYWSLFLTITLFAGLIASCKQKTSNQEASTQDAQEVADDTKGREYTVDTDQSTIYWTGSKPTGQHNGSLKLSQGSIHVFNGLIGSAKMSIDMASLTNSDVEDPDDRANLEDHLKSSDFFDVTQYPEAKFDMTKTVVLKGDESDGDLTHLVYGNLTMKNISKEIGFKAKLDIQDEMITIHAPAFKIDRTNWDVRYKSKKFFDNLKDKFIHDEISVSIKLAAKKV